VTTSEFDAVAEDFDRFRALPAEVPAAIRRSMWETLDMAPAGRVLDLGAGTGRIGEAFVAAGDVYLGVDASARMLAQFAGKAARRGTPTPVLVQADGRRLPFPTGTFDAVMIVQVISALPGWRGLLAEARRILRPGGGLVLGKSIGPPDGLDARMRAQLSRILAEAGIAMHRRGGEREDALAWLAHGVRRLTTVVAASWEATRSPRDFLDRHATGARFSALPQSIRQVALQRLSDWAVITFGSLDALHLESRSFVLDVCLY
jgi:ubiquinone/menaquinone biosynthesis C-methylase UbiE